VARWYDNLAQIGRIYKNPPEDRYFYSKHISKLKSNETATWLTSRRWISKRNRLLNDE